MKKGIGFIVAALMITVSAAHSQVRPDADQMAAFATLYTRFDSAFAVHWNEQTGTPDVMTFWKHRAFARNPRTSAELFLQEIRGLLKQRSTDDEFKFERTREEDGIRHVRLRQVYKNLPVRGGEYVVTVLQGNKVQSVLGGFYPSIDIDVNAKLTAEQALSAARQNEPPHVELADSLKTSQLLVYPKNGNYHLAWELRVPIVRGLGAWVYIVDASSGNVLERYDEARHLLLPQPVGNVYLRHPGLDNISVSGAI